MQGLVQPGALIQVDPAGPRLPPWLRKGDSHFASVHDLKSELRRLRLHTVCESARCPNLHECFHRGAATFMILGNLCTRGCGFCSVPKSRHPGALDPEEPAHVASMAQAMRLRYVVITSVNRDDLPDGGSEHFAQTVREVRRALPEAGVETLTPDFCGNLDAVARVLAASPDVFNHNVETVPRLYRTVRPQADYEQSLAVLRFAKNNVAPSGASLRPASYSSDTPQEEGQSPETSILNRDREGASTPLVKSGAMLGLGETPAEVEHLLRDLRDAGVDVVTLGQYLQPARRNLPVAEYITPERFDLYREYGLSLGFKMVFSGPLVRSSYMADLVREQSL
jgi:lipoyl synthase